MNLYLMGIPALRVRAYSLRMSNVDDLTLAAKKQGFIEPNGFAVDTFFVQAGDVHTLEDHNAGNYLLGIIVSGVQITQEWAESFESLALQFDINHCRLICAESNMLEIKAALPKRLHGMIKAADTSFEGASQIALELICAEGMTKTENKNKSVQNQVANPANQHAVSHSHNTSSSSYQHHIDALMAIEGAEAAAFVDGANGQALAQSADSEIDLAALALGDTSMMNASNVALALAQIEDQLEGIVVTLNHHHHVTYPIGNHSKVFICMILNKAKAVLARATPNILEIAKKSQAA